MSQLGPVQVWRSLVWVVSDRSVVCMFRSVQVWSSPVWVVSDSVPLPQLCWLVTLELQYPVCLVDCIPSGCSTRQTLADCTVQKTVA